MKRSFKRILIGTGIVLAVLALGAVGIVFKMKSELKKMHTIETKEVVHNVFAIKDSFVNMFLVKGNDTYVAIDAGNDIDVISQELNKLNINPDKVVAVLLTHTDGDHTGALKLFKNATIYLSRQEEQMINGKTAKMLFMHNKIYTTKYTLLEDQQIIDLGYILIKAIQTPGHTPGSMSYLLNDRYLFVGDAFGLKDGKISKPNEFFSMDMKSAIQSFGKITNLPNAEYIFTAHNGYSDNYKNAVDIQLK